LLADDKRFIPGFEKYFEKKSLSTSTNVPLLWTGAGPVASRMPTAVDGFTCLPAHTRLVCRAPVMLPL